MELNWILFPAPSSSYLASDFDQELRWVPRRNPAKDQTHIPCLYLPYRLGASKILIYFHGNAEDLGQAYGMMDEIRANLMIHVIGVEYPGYGIYKGSSSEKQILEDAESVFSFLTDQVGWSPSDVILCGRSIGSGPATELASRKNPCALALVSPYTSIRDVASHVAGTFLSKMLAQRFENERNIENVNCPTFIVHGKNDALIPWTHSVQLTRKCPGNCTLYAPDEMDHCRIDVTEDLAIPMARFFGHNDIDISPKKDKETYAALDREFTETPESFERRSYNKGSFLHRLSRILA
eukprot:CAMPEP_0115017390 /NCGR_PEP_ID=MMETSP0216-20121206/28091_1 /TAXON_ID=223996 /ORGANISM="Protocruzia adherens, Strain Boccale" /LENGTH=293 /DNA_ID=CAMNT_0002388203 /DNA_START=357 /DNA_END=1238 /DNA_ORIENTATION=-